LRFFFSCAAADGAAKDFSPKVHPLGLKCEEQGGRCTIAAWLRDVEPSEKRCMTIRQGTVLPEKEIAMPIALSVVYLFLALAGTGLNLVHLEIGSGIVKSLPAIFLAACAWAYSRPRFGPWVALGVALGSVGDYSLSNAERSWFMAGLGAFLAGHVAYSIAFAKDLRWTPARAWIVGVCTLAMAALTAAVSIRMAHANAFAEIPPVCVYVTVMGVMMALAVFHESPTRLIAAGAVVFVISDAHIAVNHMLLDTARLGLALSGYATYYLAQYLIVAGAIAEARQWAAVSTNTME